MAKGKARQRKPRSNAGAQAEDAAPAEGARPVESVYITGPECAKLYTDAVVLPIPSAYTFDGMLQCPCNAAPGASVLIGQTYTWGPLKLPIKGEDKAAQLKFGAMVSIALNFYASSGHTTVTMPPTLSYQQIYEIAHSTSFVFPYEVPYMLGQYRHDFVMFANMLAKGLVSLVEVARERDLGERYEFGARCVMCMCGFLLHDGTPVMTDDGAYRIASCTLPFEWNPRTDVNCYFGLNEKTSDNQADLIAMGSLCANETLVCLPLVACVQNDFPPPSRDVDLDSESPMLTNVFRKNPLHAERDYRTNDVCLRQTGVSVACSADPTQCMVDMAYLNPLVSTVTAVQSPRFQYTDSVSLQHLLHGYRPRKGTDEAVIYSKLMTLVTPQTTMNDLKIIEFLLLHCCFTTCRDLCYIRYAPFFGVSHFHPDIKRNCEIRMSEPGCGPFRLELVATDPIREGETFVYDPPFRTPAHTATVEHYFLKPDREAQLAADEEARAIAYAELMAEETEATKPVQQKQTQKKRNQVVKRLIKALGSAMSMMTTSIQMSMTRECVTTWHESCLLDRSAAQLYIREEKQRLHDIRMQKLRSTRESALTKENQNAIDEEINAAACQYVYDKLCTDVENNAVELECVVCFETKPICDVEPRIDLETSSCGLYGSSCWANFLVIENSRR